MKSILFIIAIIYCTRVSAQNGDSPMIIDGRLCEILGDFKMEIKSCEQFKQFKYKFPYFYIDKDILLRFKHCNDSAKISDTVFTQIPIYIKTVNGKQIIGLKKTKNSKVFYGWAGIKKEPIDSSKYFYRRFMAERKCGIPDSLNKFKSKLYKK